MDFLLNLFIILVIGYLMFIMIGPARVWTWIFGPADMGAIDFKSFTRTSKPNHALFAPEGYCVNAKIDIMAPIYDMPIEALRIKVLSMIDATNNSEQVHQDFENQSYRYVVRTSMMRYPDTINVKFIKIDDKRSTMAIFSTSQIGHSDLGVNKKRILSWIKQL